MKIITFPANPYNLRWIRCSDDKVIVDSNRRLERLEGAKIVTPLAAGQYLHLKGLGTLKTPVLGMHDNA